MNLASKIDVKSEIGALRKVLIHPPGLEWDLVPCGPKALDRYLIEDIFVLGRAREEHDCLSRILELFLGRENVLRFESLLGEACNDKQTRVEIIAAVAALESLGRETIKKLSDLSPEEVASALIRGAVIRKEDESRKSSYKNIFRPLPNLLFTRDLAWTILLRMARGSRPSCVLAPAEATIFSQVVSRQPPTNAMIHGHHNATRIPRLDFSNPPVMGLLESGPKTSAGRPDRPLTISISLGADIKDPRERRCLGSSRRSSHLCS